MVWVVLIVLLLIAVLALWSARNKATQNRGRGALSSQTVKNGSSSSGRSQAPPSQEWAIPSTGLPHVTLTPGRAVEVVGESFYQPALKSAAGGRAASSWDQGIVVDALLIPDPKNPHDPHAVRVEVLGRTVGHLPRDIAADYQQVLMPESEVIAGRCRGRILGGGSRNYGIWLHIALPEVLVPRNRLEGGIALDAERQVTVTGEEQHQDTLRSLTGDSLPVALWATLRESTTSKGKYAGHPCIDVHIEGARVGCLTATMSDRYLDVVRANAFAGNEVACAALVSSDHRGLQVTLSLPSA